MKGSQKINDNEQRCIDNQKTEMNEFIPISPNIVAKTKPILDKDEFQSPNLLFKA